jgi:hypothetical protein
MTVLRRAASTSGAEPLRTWLASSPVELGHQPFLTLTRTQASKAAEV